MQDVMTTFDAIRGLPSAVANRVASLIWDAAKRDSELRDELESAVADFIEWESRVVHEKYSTFLNERGMDYFEEQDDRQLADIPW